MNTKLKKGLTIGAIVFIAMLVITTIVLACVKVSFNQFTLNNVAYVTVYKDGNSNTYAKGTPEFGKVMNNFEKGTNENILSSLFQSGFSAEGKAKVEAETKSFSTIISGSNVTLVQLHYLDQQTLKINGEVYKNKNNNPVVYESVLIEITNNNSLNQVKAYIRDIHSSSSSPTSAYLVKLLTHHKSLFEYINNLSEEGFLIQ